METLKDKKESYIKAKEKVRQIQIFYMHLVGYIIIVMLLSYNLYIVGGEYKNFIIWLDLIVLVLWAIFILVHAWRVFKGRRLFKKSWEERKMKEYMDKEERKKQ